MISITSLQKWSAETFTSIELLQALVLELSHLVDSNFQAQCALSAGSRAYLDAFHVVPIEGPLLTNLTRSGTEDPLQESNEVFLSHPGKLDDETRLPRIERGVELIIRQFEYLYQGIYGERKEQLVQYKEFLKKNLSTLNRENT